MSGLFIVLEGPEGAGKSTVAQQLAGWLREQLAAHGSSARKVVLTKEPGGTPVGDAIRSVLLDPGQQIAPLTEFLLFSASRAQHVQDVIRPALEQGDAVICDRFTASSVAYQGAGRGLDQELVSCLNRTVSQQLQPDLTVLLDIDAGMGLRRIAARGEADRLEQADPAFHARVQASFLEQARQGDWLVVDAAQPQQLVFEQVTAGLHDRLGRWFSA